jgi:hypothetical protein
MSERNRLDELYRRATAGKADVDVDALARSVADGRPDPAVLAESSDAALAWRIAREIEPEAGMLAAALGNAASPVVVPMRARAPRLAWLAAGAALAAGLATVAIHRPVVTERMPSAPDVASAVAPAVAGEDRILAGSSFEGDETAARPGTEAPEGVLFNDDFGS